MIVANADQSLARAGGGLQSGEPQRHQRLHPVLIMVAMLFATIAVTHLIPAGKFQRHDGRVVPGTYEAIPKINGLPALLAPTAPTESQIPARAAGVVAAFSSVPAGMVKSASLIAMLMFVGGLFGVLRSTGAIDAGVDSLVHLTAGNAYLLTTGLILLLACGSTFLGFQSEYIVIIPLLLQMGERLGLPRLFAPAIAITASMIGWAASVTNPLAVTLAQRLAGVPILSGLSARLGIFAALVVVGLAYVLIYLRKLPKTRHVPEPARLTGRQLGVLLALATGAAGLVTGTALWSWGSQDQAASFVAIAVLLAVIGGLRPAKAADAFLDGMKSMMLMSLIFGLGSATEIILRSSQVLDSIVQGLAHMIQGHTGGVVAISLMVGQMLFTLLIHSAAPKAAISLPVLTPIAQLSGVSGQVTVTALLVGSGVTNMISPTNSVLLAFLAASKVGYADWLRFAAPLFILLCAVGFAALYIMAALGA